MKLYYIYHSCFVIDIDDYLIVFDYYKVPWLKDNNFKMEDLFIDGKKIIVFSSHSHPDHFSKEIFKWDNGNRQITYVLSDDIHIAKDQKNCHMVKEGESLYIEGIDIIVFGSSDIGVSFLVKISNKVFFHAGDLNWWKWDEETKDEQLYAENLFKGIIGNIKSYLTANNENIDIAFIPVDPRLDDNTYLGGETYIKQLSPKLLVPMHFWDKFYITKYFADVCKKLQSKSMIITKNIELLNIE